MPAIHVTKENFEQEVLFSNIPVLVDFWAPWCNPCKMVGPLIEDLANEFDGKAKVVKVNIDDEGEIAIQYNVMSIPTVVVFKGGEEKSRSVGASSKNDYRDMLIEQL